MKLEKIPMVSTEKEERFGFRLIKNGHFIDLFARSKELQDKWMVNLKQFCILSLFSSNYINIKVIGKGTFAKVKTTQKFLII